jgi:hypothetical protein
VLERVRPGLRREERSYHAGVAHARSQVIAHLGTVAVDAAYEEEAEELVATDEGGYSPKDLTQSTADVFLDFESLEK